MCLKIKCHRRESNPRRPALQAGALPTELQWRIDANRFHAPERTRTYNPHIRSVMLYPIELQAHTWEKRDSNPQSLRRLIYSQVQVTVLAVLPYYLTYTANFEKTSTSNVAINRINGCLGEFFQTTT